VGVASSQRKKRGTEFVEAVRKERGIKIKRPFTLPGLRSVLALANDEWRSMILFGLYTGQRLGDIATLRSALSGAEHLTLLVGKKSVALALIRHFGSLKGLARASFQELRQFLPRRQAESVVAALSMSVISRTPSTLVLSSSTTPNQSIEPAQI
jgi:hypothetical protein